RDFHVTGVQTCALPILFRDYLRDWPKTVRKKNAAVLLATQNLSDIFNSKIRDVVLESCPTKILLPNAEAGNPASREFYHSIGLRSEERRVGKECRSWL